MGGKLKETIAKVTGVRGQVVVVSCISDYRPALRELLTSPEDLELRLEVHSYKSDHEMYCLLLSPRDRVYRNLDISTTGEQITIPVGKSVMGRIIDLYGNPKDGLGPLEEKSEKSIYKKYRVGRCHYYKWRVCPYIKPLRVAFPYGRYIFFW